FFHPPCDHSHLHSFPTRRSSDLSRLCSPTVPDLLPERPAEGLVQALPRVQNRVPRAVAQGGVVGRIGQLAQQAFPADRELVGRADRKSTRLNSSHLVISYAVFCL